MLCRHWMDWEKDDRVLQASIRNVLLRHRSNGNNSAIEIESGSNNNIKNACKDLPTSKSGGTASSSMSSASGSGSGIGDDDLFCINCNFR